MSNAPLPCRTAVPASDARRRVRFLAVVSAVAAVALLAPGAVHAQIVNIERILAGEPVPGLQGALQLTFGLREGNTESRRFEGNGLLRWRGGPTVVQIVLGGSYETARGRKVADSAIGHIRYGYLFDSGIRLEALLQVQQNAFLRLQRRTLVGAGVRLPLFSGARPTEGGGGQDRIDLGVIVMHESEDLRGPDSEPAWRASILLSFGWGLSESASVGSQLYYQPLMDDPADFRLLNDFGLSVKLLGPLSAKIDARLVYDSSPPPLVKRTDLVLRNSLAISF